jgi:hypothetical protein
MRMLERAPAVSGWMEKIPAPPWQVRYRARPMMRLHLLSTRVLEAAAEVAMLL